MNPSFKKASIPSVQKDLQIGSSYNFRGTTTVSPKQTQNKNYMSENQIIIICKDVFQSKVCSNASSFVFVPF